MKKSLFFIPAAALLMASCANEDFDGANNNGYNGPTESRYLAVNIVGNNDATRADDDYEAGSSDENEVTFVRFYLFGPQGGEFVNTSIDCTAEETGSDMPNVEKILHSVIVFEAPAGDPEPIQIVAVVNAPSTLAESYTSPAELQGEIDNYNVTEAGKFVMSNSVYVAQKDGNAEEYVGVPIATSYSSREEALQNPTDIYVERVVAKARVNVAETMTKVEGKDYYKIMTKTDDSYANTATIQIDVYDKATDKLVKKNVYLKLLGWDVTGTAPKSRLVKKVQSTWGSDWGWIWNTTDYSRSFWAQNPADVNNVDALTFGNFNVAQSVKGFANPVASSDPKNYTYLQENAAWAADGKTPSYATKLIVAGQLIGEDEKPLELAWWKGSYYMQNDLLQVFATESRIFSSADGKTFNPISVDDLEFVSYEDLNGPTGKDVKSDSDPKAKRYYSYVQLNENFDADKTWYKKDGQGNYIKIETAAANTINSTLKGMDIVKVWSNGYTYYWVDIAHLGKNGYGDKGVVRNHIYDFALTSFVGLGIPVFINPDYLGDPDDPTDPDDPDEWDDIYPEDPEDPEYAFISARINVLSWRIVKHDNTQLGWQ